MSDGCVPPKEAVRKAKFQSGIAALPFSSPQLAVKREQKVEVIGLILWHCLSRKMHVAAELELVFLAQFL